MNRIWKSLIFWIVLSLTISGDSWSIDSTIGGSVDPVTPYPTLITQLSTSAGYAAVIVTSFLGIRSTNPPLKDADGLGAWTNTSALPGGASGVKGVETDGSRYIVFGTASNTPPTGGCSAYYSDDTGSTWTEVKLNDGAGFHLDNCQPSNDPVYGLKAFGNTVYATGVELNPGAPCLTPPCLVIDKSTNSGTNFAVSFFNESGAANRNIREGGVFYYDGTNVIVASGPRTGCTSAGGTGYSIIVSSTNDGTSWNIFNTTDCWQFRAATKLGGTYYLIGDVLTTTDVPTIFTSTDLITWTSAGSPTLSPNIVQANIAGGMYAFGCFTGWTKPACYYTVFDSSDSTLHVFVSENATSFSEIANLGAGVGGGNHLIQNTNSLFNELYFSTSTNVFYSIR